MDKEGQPIQFSSDKIAEKQKPDFFVASNEKAERRKRFSPKTIFSKIGIFFKSLGAKLLDYFKHPFRGKHKIATIMGIIVVIVAIVLIVLNITIWSRNTSKDPTPLSNEELAEWKQELSNINAEALVLSDGDLMTFYANKIDEERSEAKVVDLTMAYSRELSSRAYIDLSQKLLDSLNIDDMTCDQVTSYYSAYAYLFFALSNQQITSEYDKYQHLAEQNFNKCYGYEEGDPDYIDSYGDTLTQSEDSGTTDEEGGEVNVSE